MDLEQERKGISRRKFLNMAATALGGIALVACGQSGGGGGGEGGGGAAATAGAGGGGGGAATGATTGAAGAAGGGAAGGASGAIKWSTWGNPGEVQRFREYTDDFNKRFPNIKSELVHVPNEGYEAKMLTQLSGGAAPDVFYSGDGSMGKFISSGAISELTTMLAGPTSKSNPNDFFPGLWGAAQTADNKIYGVAVDCNPMVLWYNKKVLQEIGVTEMPADTYKAGNWNWNTFQSILDKAAAKNKRGYVLGNWFAHHYSWVTTNGGKVIDGGKYVAHEDAKAQEAYKWIADNIKAKRFTYSGGLPKGQGDDALFMSGQLAFLGAGRWLLPVFKKASGLEYDIVPFPTNTGKKTEPAGIPTAYAVMNAKTKSPEAAFQFLTDFVSKEGQIFRLKGGGNAVPSIKGADEVVGEGNLPQNWQALLDAREVGYALWREEAGTPGLSADIIKVWEPLWLKGEGDVNATLQKVGQLATSKIKA